VSNIVSTDWLAEHLNEAVILDCSWHLPAANRNAAAEFEVSHIANAQFFDIDLHSDKSTTLPHMLPTSAAFEHAARQLGINTTSKVICYDSVGLFSAARVWWMFKIFGHSQVHVLDGGLKKWLAEGRPTNSAKITTSTGDFKAQFSTEMVKNISQVASEKAQVIDARSPTRFRGEEPEPRPGVKPGHIPSAKNIHYASLLNPDGTMKTASELAKIFASTGIDLEKPITTSCGSGVTAAILSLALTELKATSHALYDGSWAEWGSSGRAIALG
jgi:thiosulfate/3-mercaptopyruvate sulfurtransferase